MEQQKPHEELCSNCNKKHNYFLSVDPTLCVKDEELTNTFKNVNKLDNKKLKEELDFFYDLMAKNANDPKLVREIADVIQSTKKAYL